MTSKEALKIIRNIIINEDPDWDYIAYLDDYHYYKKQCDTIEKDLELLEILKKYLCYDNKNHCVKMKKIYKSTYNFDYEDLKEWLEHDSQTND